MLLPVPYPFTGTRPETGWQTPQQFQHGSLEGHAATEPLQHQQPEHNQRRVDRVVAPYTNLILHALQEIQWQKALKQNENPLEGGLVNDRRERECSTCAKSGYHKPETNRPVFVLIPETFTPAATPRQKLCGIRHSCQALMPAAPRLFSALARPDAPCVGTSADAARKSACATSATWQM